MAKLPGWLKQEGSIHLGDDGRAYVTIKLRLWHPSFWLEFTRIALVELWGVLKDALDL